jgi:hypothetical protein
LISEAVVVFGKLLERDIPQPSTDSLYSNEPTKPIL